MPTNYERGRQAEYRSKALLERQGYNVIRAAGSHGPVDLIGYNYQELVFVQVKLNRQISREELAALAALSLPANCRKVVHHYTTGEGKPQVLEVG